jgi:hypothetical protein
MVHASVLARIVFTALSVVLVVANEDSPTVPVFTVIATIPLEPTSVKGASETAIDKIYKACRASTLVHSRLK